MTNRNLKREIQDLMSEALEAAQLFAPSDFAFKSFRKRILDRGNQIIRDFSAERINLRVESQTYRLGEDGQCPETP